MEGEPLRDQKAVVGQGVRGVKAMQGRQTSCILKAVVGKMRQSDLQRMPLFPENDPIGYCLHRFCGV
jgi:hypothetical protein